MKYFRILPIALILALFACGNNNNQEASNEESTESTESATTEDYSGMREVDLSEYGIMASIMVPAESKGKLEMEETSWGSLTLQVGDKFGMEIVPFGLSLEEAKAEFDQGGVYEIEVIEENDNYVLYKKTIPNAEVKEEFHVFMNSEMNGEIYEIKSMAELELKEVHARNVLKSAKSFKGKEAI